MRIPGISYLFRSAGGEETRPPRMGADRMQMEEAAPAVQEDGRGGSIAALRAFAFSASLQQNLGPAQEPVVKVRLPEPMIQPPESMDQIMSS